MTTIRLSRPSDWNDPAAIDVATIGERRVDDGAVALAHCSAGAVIMLMLHGRGEVLIAGRTLPIDGLTLVGPTTGLCRVALHGPATLLTIKLTTTAWRDLCARRGSLYLDQAVPAALLMAERGAAFEADLRAAADFDARVRVVTECARLSRAMVKASQGDAAFVNLTETWLTKQERPDLADLVERSGLSRRQVERRCKRLFGVPPRMLARRHRAILAARRLVEAAALDEVIGIGFYDQSHLIRELRHFTGLTPRRLGGRSGDAQLMLD